jgi:hypothetical protein
VNVPSETYPHLPDSTVQAPPALYGKGAIDPESIAGRLGYYPDQFPHNANGGANVVQITVASGPARLYGFQGINSNAAARFIQVFDTPSAVANGAVPQVVITAAIAGNFSAFFGDTGRWFDRGIVIATSSTLATLTLGSADMWIDVQWA